MTSIAASPAFSELKKRSRHAAADSFELSRSKRYRGLEAAPSAEETAAAEAAKDVPKYTQRHVEFFEQAKQAEIARIRAEYEQFIMKKEVEFQSCRRELQQLHEATHAKDKDAERLNSENKLLKRAITIQNQQKEECQQENAVLRNLATQAAEHIKRLEQSNYALSVHLQTSTSTSSEHFQPPDVF
jgi:DNA repair exonuclease SbcCD ATPase subunit